MITHTAGTALGLVTCYSKSVLHGTIATRYFRNEMYFKGVEIEKPPLGASERCAPQCCFDLMDLHQKVSFLQCGIAIFLENTNGENQVSNVNHYVKNVTFLMV